MSALYEWSKERDTIDSSSYFQDGTLANDTFAIDVENIKI
jgi:hypothetical protein